MIEDEISHLQGLAEKVVRGPMILPFSCTTALSSAAARLDLGLKIHFLCHLSLYVSVSSVLWPPFHCP
jgi:hypothetical protein